MVTGDPTTDVPVAANHRAGRAVRLTPEELRCFDAALICTDHDGIDYRSLVQLCPVVIDTRDAGARAGIGSGAVVKA